MINKVLNASLLVIKRLINIIFIDRYKSLLTVGMNGSLYDVILKGDWELI